MMTVICSGKAAPGATTSTWALALAWPAPVLAVDADPAGGDMVPGLLAGRVQLEQSVVSWLSAVRRVAPVDAATAFGEHVVGLPEAPNVWLLPGFQNWAQAPAQDVGSWDRLAAALQQAGPVLGRDVLVDAGRLSDASCWPVIRAADRVLLTVRRTVRSIHAAGNAAAMVRSRLGDLDAVSVLVVGPGPYPSGQITRELGVSQAFELPHDRGASAVLSDGAAVGVLGLRRSKLLIAARSLAGHLVGASAPVGAVGVGSGR